MSIDTSGMSNGEIRLKALQVREEARKMKADDPQRPNKQAEAGEWKAAAEAGVGSHL